jgi:hypothetical protein
MACQEPRYPDTCQDNLAAVVCPLAISDMS